MEGCFVILSLIFQDKNKRFPMRDEAEECVKAIWFSKSPKTADFIVIFRSLYWIETASYGVENEREFN